MAEEKKEGIFAKLFGGKKSGCCNMKIEEIPEEQQTGDAEKQPACGPSCCCGSRPTDKK